MKSENKNFLYNVVFQLLTFIIPFITVPYISRVLGVDNIGIYSYTYSIVYLFMLFAMLGITNYGNRAIVSVRDDSEKLSITFSSIYSLQLTVSFIAIILYYAYCFFVCKEYKFISLIQSILLLSVCFDINWFYFGIEKFKLTITRNLIIKFSSLLLVFLFVKDEDDLPIYTLIMAGSYFISQIYLVIILRKFTHFRIECFKVSIKHIKGVMILFVPVLAFGIYKVMDKTMIGKLSNVTQLGYYENAEKIINIPSAVISALGTVMLPRMSYLINKSDSGYKKTIEESMMLVMKLATIMCMGLLLISNEVVVVLFGKDFFDSGPILKWLSISILASAWANVIRTQYLIPLKKDRIYIFSTIGAALLNVIFNAIFIPLYGGIGACIGTVVAEFFVAIYQMIVTKNELDHLKYLYLFLKELIIAVFISTFALIVSKIVVNIYYSLLLKIVISILLFGLINFKYFKTDFFGKDK